MEIIHNDLQEMVGEPKEWADYERDVSNFVILAVTFI